MSEIMMIRDMKSANKTSEDKAGLVYVFVSVRESAIGENGVYLDRWRKGKG